MPLLLSQLIERVADNVLAANEEREERARWLVVVRKDRVDVLVPGLLQGNLLLNVRVRLQEKRLAARVEHERVVAEKNAVGLKQSG